MDATPFQRGIKLLKFAGLGAPVIVLMMLAMMVFPLPPFLLDLFFTFNIALALLVLLVVIYAGKPLDFAVFPTILLVATLLRLALNVASTRVVLLEGDTGPDAAGKVIQAFGEVVIGGNYTVGFVVFIILILINFIVVTKGAGRISEVSARFTLDAMPGKQMAIDADLNAGLVSPDEAKARRAEVAQEADFYGAMDGASKFVRGDAIAGILILLINLIGGVAIGTMDHGMSFSEAFQRYSLMTIGDGLVAQIPSLLLSTSAAIMVTRVSTSETDVGKQIFSQLFSHYKVFMIAAGVMAAIGLVPGMPHLAFLMLAAVLGGVAYLLKRSEKDKKAEEVKVLQQEAAASQPDQKELSWDDIGQVDILGLEIGYRLIPMVDKEQGGDLTSRIKGVRKKLSQELGFLIPSVHIRDNLDLTPNHYRITLMGVNVAEAEIYADMELAINPGQVVKKLDGIATRDPAFSLEATWIDKSLRERAQTLGYTVVDASTVIATHVSQILQQNSSELLGYEEVQLLLDQLAKTAPKLVDNLVPDILSLAVIAKVLQGLLYESIPIRDIRTICETLVQFGGQSQDPDALREVVRMSLKRLIMQQINGLSQELPVITLDPYLEQILQQAFIGDGTGSVEPGLAERLNQSLTKLSQKQEALSQPAVVAVSPQIRQQFSRFIRQGLPNVFVISYQEITDDKQIKIIASIGQEGA
ncbi:Flagellar biosynthesis protein FlhA [Piscirickettsia salmonis]|uniref:Flagellar biosynthesis protein FlhA n=1 Tax=Piscirickettsia salmonis TaxID=1238 RepID=A0A1L6TBS7_PISSA|nr:flagellar biosynthesis protein FlhA [Piscirickettsia salmonis]AKP73880.1 flagellar biosynthesis protein FlhA [Piscirickettsia salmonis LF-89 = ATCC VR-1361]ALB22690.1 flagellar biosynthesis protein FlhA [Piscirickettsia salmonis]ALY02698.1 flagellar biosynthesis protein FlhA [Piscirickettsia salmonis]AMA42243.1 flagellar biosynthesis protein FlhA [Piscirickettsia salmonis]AOS34718.1 flagellar biosynthesis protein FlhA [Piscirickettsia salmonis]